MWVPKVPRRFDFCGCPPCPLCFEWEEPMGEDLCDPVVVEGLVKMTEDLTGKPFSEATPEEVQQVKDIGDDMHQRALAGVLLEKPPDPSGAIPEEELRWLEAKINERGRAVRAKKEYQERVNKPKSLDQMDWGASEEAKELLDKETQGKKKMKELEEAVKEERRKESQRIAYERMLGPDW